MNYNELAQEYFNQAEDVYDRIVELKQMIRSSNRHSTIKNLRTRIVVLEQIYGECRVTAHHIIKNYGGDA